jgi:CRISPR/Cas system CSM-associated protein Csm3 (group 7 of RAMP superfamily)
MTSLRIDLTITAATAFSIGAGGSAGTIADKTIARDGWNRPIIPGSQVKGRVRAAAEQILRGLGQTIPSPFDERALVEGDASPIRRLFGSPEWRSPLHFNDLPGIVGPLEPDQIAAVRGKIEQQRSQIRPSVSINRRRGTAEDARLLFQETTLEGIRFSSAQAILGHVESTTDAALLWAALKLSTRWGGAKSRGLGWATVDVTVYYDTRPLEEAALQQALPNLLRTRSR